MPVNMRRCARAAGPRAGSTGFLLRARGMEGSFHARPAHGLSRRPHGGLGRLPSPLVTGREAQTGTDGLALAGLAGRRTNRRRPETIFSWGTTGRAAVQATKDVNRRRTRTGAVDSGHELREQEFLLHRRSQVCDQTQKAVHARPEFPEWSIARRRAQTGVSVP